MNLNRRQTLAAMAGLALTTAAPGAIAATGGARVIPSTGESIPVVGLGTWIVFNVGDDKALIDRSAEVMRAFFREGGGMIDSSPMYGSSQDTIGYGLEALNSPSGLFSAEKVWTRDGEDGPRQIATTRRKWGVPKFDLLQVHNLVGLEAHLETLFQMKADGELRYVGVTTSHGRRHRDLERIMRDAPLDFVQLTYNVRDRAAERRLLPFAAEKGIGVIVNRPYRRGALIDALAGKPLPNWADEIGAASWPQFLLKFVTSHPAVTTVIPATSNPSHMTENKAAGRGVQPDARMRRRMAEYFESL